MKLGGLTWWRGNYGSILQAYALQTRLNDIENIDYEIICQYGSKVVSTSNTIDKLRSIGVIKTLRRAFWKYAVPQLRKRTNRLQTFIDQNLKISDIQYTEKSIGNSNEVYDGFICGSDQIWNPEFHDQTGMYRLRFAKDNKRKVAYAPSIGVSSLSLNIRTDYYNDLVRLDAISCREENGTKLINSLLGKNKCTTVLDPTLLVNKKIWNKICAPRKFDEDYIFVYMLRGNKFQRREIEKFAKQHNLKIVTIPFLETDYIVPYDLVFGDYKIWDATPDEFISLIRYASYIFTDSFHSSVFSCIYHREFYVFPKIGKAQNDRLSNLMKILCIPNRLINNAQDIDGVAKIDWDIVDQQIMQKRSVSDEYLIKSLMSR